MKNDGRYTAYHIYQGLSFTEANKASTAPYRSAAMKCAHSQRGYLFHFDSMAERNHFDAANTSCCDEPIMNFASKPQYSAASRPMNPKDCGRPIKTHGCEVLEISVQDHAPGCASDSPRPIRIKIRCPKFCPEFSAMASGESFSGRNGKFRLAGIEAGEVMIMDYLPHQVVLDDIYARCAGRTTLTEMFCDGNSLEFSILAGLDSPSGCGCDCCGDMGIFPGPTMTIDAPEAITGAWGNSISFRTVVTADSACPGGAVTGEFVSVNGSEQPVWDGASVYMSDGVTRYLTRKAVSAGSSANSACCGGFVEWKATDGCGGVKTATTVVSSPMTGYSVSPENGAILSDGVIYEFSVGGVCSYSDSADLTLSVSCLENVQGPVTRGDGYMKSALDGALTLGPAPSCSSCCGSGSISMSFSDGCGRTGAASFSVNKGLSYGASGLLIGKSLRCSRFYVTAPVPGYVYDVEMAPLYCDGRSGPYSRTYWGSYSTVSECESKINSPQAGFINSSAALSDLPEAESCLFYCDNSQTGLGLVSRIISIHDKCCRGDWGDISWIKRSNTLQCCPN